MNIPFPTTFHNTRTNVDRINNSNNSQQNSRIHSPNRVIHSAPLSASAQLVFTNANATAHSSFQTPVSSSPVPALVLENHQNNNVAESSRLSTPQLPELLNSFQQQHNERNEIVSDENNENGGDNISYVIDIPDDNNNPDPAPSPTGSQVGIM